MSETRPRGSEGEAAEAGSTQLDAALDLPDQAAARPAPVRLRARRSLSPIWFVPLVAAAIAGWIAWQNLQHAGPRIEILFESGEGLEPTRTPIKFKDVGVGMVESVGLTQDLRRIRVVARMDRTIEPYLTDRASFWIARPRVGVGGVSGLTTLLSGTYIEMDAAPGGQELRQFEGVEEAPLIRQTAPGRYFVLTADALGSVSRGAPVYFRNVEVGQVLGYELADQDSQVRIHIFVRAPHDELVRANTRFWNASGIRANAGGGGFALTIPPLQALLVGGVEFEAFPQMGEPEAVSADASFRLYDSRDAVLNDSGGPTERYLVHFDSSVRGLAAGAPVEFRGIRVGSVTDVDLELDVSDEAVRIPVQLQIEPGRIRLAGVRERPSEPGQIVQRLVQRGMRARLATASLITGDLYVSLDFFPALPKAQLGRSGDLPEIPTVPSQFEQLTASASQILDRLASLPIEGVIDDLRKTLAGVREVATGEPTRQSLAALERSLAHLDELTAGLQREVPPIVGSVRATADAATATLRDLRSTAGSVNDLLGPNSSLRYDLSQAIKQLGEAARSVRGLADYLDRHPDALLRGR